MPLNIKVGQQWRTRGGDVVGVLRYDDRTTTPYVWDVDGGSRDPQGFVISSGMPNPGDLIEQVGGPGDQAQRLAVAAPIYAAMLASAEPVKPDDAIEAMRDLARRALSHADILIQEAQNVVA